jgi:hypothetical protein
VRNPMRRLLALLVFVVVATFVGFLIRASWPPCTATSKRITIGNMVVAGRQRAMRRYEDFEYRPSAPIPTRWGQRYSRAAAN